MSTFACPIVTIKTVTKHPNADSLDIITFEETGWKCVDKIGIRKPGDSVIYIPVDANVPVDKPEFEFLKSRAKSNGLCRIRTIKLRGEISQGLVIDIPKITDFDIVPGIDTSTFFDITKYEPPQEQVFSVNAKGSFFPWCPKTDAERYQQFNRTIQSYLDNTWVATLKVDGTSMTVGYDSFRVAECILLNDEFGVCSRNQELKSPEEMNLDAESNGQTPWGFKLDIYWSTTRKFNLLEKAKQIAIDFGYDRVAIQCELAGPGIQDNHLKLTEVQPFCFDIYVTQGESSFYIDIDTRIKLCKTYEIPEVIVYKRGSLAEIVGKSVDQFQNVDFSSIQELKYESGFPIEGLVFVPIIEQYVGTLGRLKFKFINPIFEIETDKKKDKKKKEKEVSTENATNVV